MGWLFTLGSSRADCIREQTKGWENETSKGECLAKCCTGNNLWTVFERTRKASAKDGVTTPALTYRFICLFMLSNGGESHGWGYKDVDESCGPVYYNCPLKYIEMAEQKPMPENMMSYSKEWRANVREHWSEQAAARKTAAALQPGTEFYSYGKKYTLEGNHSAKYVVARAYENGCRYRVKKTSISLSPAAGKA